MAYILFKLFCYCEGMKVRSAKSEQKIARDNNFTSQCEVVSFVSPSFLLCFAAACDGSSICASTLPTISVPITIGKLLIEVIRVRPLP